MVPRASLDSLICRPMRLRSGNRRRRGSALLIVLALLSVLVLLAVTLAFTSRIEVLSSRNFARAVQNRTAALTGVEASTMALTEALPKGALGSVDLALTERRLNGTSDAPAALKASRSASAPRSFEGLADIRVADLSARLNINTASREEIARLLDVVATRAQVPGVDAAAVAKRIADWRLGPDGAPGRRAEDDNRSARFSLAADDQKESAVEAPPEAPRRAERLRESCFGAGEDRAAQVKALRTGEDEKGEYVADIRYPAFGDDRRFAKVSDLLEVDGMGPELLRAAEPFLTVFSVALPAGSDDEDSRDRIDINRASAEEIHAALRTLYGETKDDNLLRQFAVNIVDARDTDMIPTAMEDAIGAGWVVGLERAPFITEIYPESRSQNATDDGEFVEIFNPWPDAIDLSGWSLEVGGLMVPLSGSLPSQGFLIVTDNYDTRADEELPGLGSFYDVHGTVALPPSRRILEFPQLDIPGNGGGTASLRYGGAVADWFVWHAAGTVSTAQSFQREGGGQTRVSRLAAKTPFGLLAATPPEKLFARPLNGPQDVPFTSVLELFEVFSGFASASGAEGRGWAFPVIASPASPEKAARAAAEDRGTIDARIADVFTVEESRRPVASELEKETADGKVESAERRVNPWEGEIPFEELADGSLAMDKAQLEALLWQRYALSAAGTRLGLVNVNTAAEPVLVAAGLDQATAAELVQRRQRLAATFAEGEAVRPALYGQISELLADDRLWGRWDGDPCERLRGYAAVENRLTVSSQSFLVEGQPLERTQSGTTGKAALRVQASVAMDKGRAELVAWDFLP